MRWLLLLVLLLLLSFSFLLTGGSFFQGEIANVVRNLDGTVTSTATILGPVLFAEGGWAQRLMWVKARSGGNMESWRKGVWGGKRKPILVLGAVPRRCQVLPHRDGHDTALVPTPCSSEGDKTFIHAANFIE